MGAIEDTPFPDMFERCESEKCLLQGDIIKISSGECEFFDGQEGALGYVIVSNSCDLERGGDEGLGWISVVPIFPYKVLLEDILENKANKIVDKVKKERNNGKVYDAKGAFESMIADMIFKEANYNPKFTFFISPLEIFDNMPTIAFDMKMIHINLCSRRLCHRISSLLKRSDHRSLLPH